MATREIEAEMSPEQVRRVVEQVPPRAFAALVAQLLQRARVAEGAAVTPAVDGGGQPAADQRIPANPYPAVAGLCADDSFAGAVDTPIASQRQREREEAAREADR